MIIIQGSGTVWKRRKIELPTKTSGRTASETISLMLGQMHSSDLANRLEKVLLDENSAVSETFTSAHGRSEIRLLTVVEIDKLVLQNGGPRYKRSPLPNETILREVERERTGLLDELDKPYFADNIRFALWRKFSAAPNTSK